MSDREQEDLMDGGTSNFIRFMVLWLTYLSLL